MTWQMQIERKYLVWHLLFDVLEYNLVHTFISLGFTCGRQKRCKNAPLDDPHDKTW